MTKSTITYARLRELLDYEPASGIFTWRKARRGTAKIGSVAGTIDGKGYVQIKVDSRLYLAHRLAWLYTFGHFPPADIDHQNGVRSDNRIDNLRPATRSQNNANSPARSDNTSGIKGVFWEKRRKKWRVQVTVNGTKYHLGYYDDAAHATAVYQGAALLAFAEYSHHLSRKDLTP